MPDHDATTVTKLREAGTVLLGKLGMHEFAFGGPSIDAPFPAVRNPWNTAHIPGGSSSGSGAALAAGLCLGSLGSDTGGSIRTPSSHCGVVGMKQTYGRVSRYGVVPLSWSLDHAGPMARNVEDCAILLQAIAGYDPKDPASANVPVPDFRAELKNGIKGLRVGVPRANWFNENKGTDSETEAIFNDALKILEGLGAIVFEIDGQPFSLARKANQTILTAEAYAYHEKRFQEAPEKFGSSVRRRMLEGAFLSAADYITALRARTVLNEQIRANFSGVDTFVTPTAPRPPEAFETIDPNEQNLRPSFTNPFNLTGLPAISLPCGFTKDNLPVGLQIVAQPFEEGTAFRVAYAYERATEWHKRRAEALEKSAEIEWPFSSQAPLKIWKYISANAGSMVFAAAISRSMAGLSRSRALVASVRTSFSSSFFKRPSSTTTSPLTMTVSTELPFSQKTS